MTRQSQPAIVDLASAYDLLSRDVADAVLTLGEGNQAREYDDVAVLPVSSAPPTVVVCLPPAAEVAVAGTTCALTVGRTTMGGDLLDRGEVAGRALLAIRIVSAELAEPPFSDGPLASSTRRAFALADEAYRRARDLVLLRQYPPDSTVDPDDLAFDLGADTDAAVYALTHLTLDGLVRRDPDRGYVVVPLDVRLSDETFDARCAIEVGVLETSLGTVADEQVEALRDSFVRMSGQLVGDRFVDFERYLDANFTFHHQIVLLGGNTALGAAFVHLGVKAVMTRSFGSTRASSQRFVDVQRAILEGIEERDLAAARMATVAYRDLAKARARAILGQTGGRL